MSCSTELEFEFVLEFGVDTGCAADAAILLPTLKEYYEIVGESRPLSVFFPTHADFFTKMHFYS